MIGLVIDVTRRFFTWWIGELKSLLPARLQWAADGRTSLLVLDLTAEAIQLYRCRGQQTENLGEISLRENDAATVRRRLALLAPEVLQGDTAVSLRLSRTDVLRKSVLLPGATKSNLREVLGYAMDLQTPFKAEEVHYDFHVVGDDADNKQVHVDLAVAPRIEVDRAITRLRDWGLRPIAVDVTEGAPAPRPRFNLLPVAESYRPSRRGRRLTVFLVGLFGLLTTAAVIVSLVRQQDALAILEVELARAREAAEAVHSLRDEVGRLKQGSRFIIRRKHQDLPTIAILNEVTRRLPDHTWVFQLRRSERRVELYGYSASASKLIQLIEASPTFADVGFQAPVTRDPQSGVERFYVAFNLVNAGEAKGVDDSVSGSQSAGGTQ